MEHFRYDRILPSVIILVSVVAADVLPAGGDQASASQLVVASHAGRPGPGQTPPTQPKSSASPNTSPTPDLSSVPAGPTTLSREMIVRLKIYLDQHSFSPGGIDGQWSDLCAISLRDYQSANGLSANGQLDAQLRQELSNLSPLYTTYQIKSEDMRWVGKSPQKPAAQARLRSMPYRSIAEFVAERFHLSEAFLRSLNRGKNLNALRPGDAVQVPNVTPFEIELIKPAEDIPPKPELNVRTVKIDTKNKILEIGEGEKVLASYPITPGSKELPAPIGTWRIVKMTTLPWFRWDKAMLLHGKRSGDFHNIPPGPRNEVGVVWIGLNKKGIGIHGTNSPDTIGHTTSHGCIRLANWDAVRVLNSVTQGMTVQIY